MEDLADAVDSLRYLVARPGTFATFFPETTEDMLISVLLDGFAEAQLEGLLLDNVASDDGVIAPELDRGQAALVTIFAAVRFLRAELINRNTSVTYEAGKAHYETTQATNILRDILKALSGQKDRLVAAIGGGLNGGGSAFYMADQYLARLVDTGDAVVVGW